MARLEVARLKRTIFNEHVCDASKNEPFSTSMFVARLEVAHLKTNHFPRAYLWRD